MITIMVCILMMNISFGGDLILRATSRSATATLDLLRCRRPFDGSRRIDYRSTAALSFAKRHGGAQGEYEGFGIARVWLCLLWSLLVATRLSRGSRRTWCSLGCPHHCCAWTDKADADRYPPSFLSARISEALARLRRRAQADAFPGAGRLVSRQADGGHGSEWHTRGHSVDRLHTRRVV